MRRVSLLHLTRQLRSEAELCAQVARQVQHPAVLTPFDTGLPALPSQPHAQLRTEAEELRARVARRDAQIAEARAGLERKGAELRRASEAEAET